MNNNVGCFAFFSAVLLIVLLLGVLGWIIAAALS